MDSNGNAEEKPLINEKDKEYKPKDLYETEKDCCCCGCCECCGCKQLRMESKNATFCFCPISIGIYFIAYTFYIVTFTETLALILDLYNQYIDGYFLAISFVILLPLYVACVLFCIYTTSKTKEGRGKLKLACILATISIALLYLWTIIYFGKLY